MVSSVRIAVLAALFAATVSPMVGRAAGPISAVGTSREAVGALTPQARGQLARQFVLKWGSYVERVYGTDVGTWSKRMVPVFVAADPTNFRKALARDTLEGALAELNGQGHRRSDEQVIDAYARAGRNASAKQVAAKLGDLTGDLAFTAVTPCRILDTRVSGGAIAANSSRNFLAVAISSGVNFTSQGGSATDCGVAAVGASAVMINVTAVTPSGAGYATVYKSGDARPTAASVNYTAGSIVNNSVVVGIPNPLAITDFTIYTFAQSHYVADIVGYFAPPQATPLNCVSTGAPQSFTIAANTTNFFNNPACPAGYAATTPYCWTASPGVLSQGSGYNANAAGNATFCSWQNTTASNQTVYGGNVCCRVPGR